MTSKRTRHKCLDPTEVYRLSNEEAYGKAKGCPICMEIVDFVAKRREINALREKKRIAQNVLREDQVNSILDRFELFKRKLVMHDFDVVIAETIGKLKPGEGMKLTSTGELLEAWYPYAFAEVIDAIRRGVDLIYNVPVQSQSDAYLLHKNLSNSINETYLKRHLQIDEVQQDKLQLHSRKDVIYFDEHREPKNRLVEVSYKLQSPFNTNRRLWITLDEKDAQDFINELEKAHNQMQQEE